MSVDATARQRTGCRRSSGPGCCRARGSASRPSGRTRFAAEGAHARRRRTASDTAVADQRGGQEAGQVGREIRRPERVDLGEVAQAPQVPLGRMGLERQHPSELVEQLVALGQVVLLADGHHVAPLVAAAPAPGDDVVDGVGRLRAVGAAAAVATQHRPARERRGAGPARDPHHVEQPHDGRHLDGEVGGVEDRAPSGRNATGSARPASTRTTARRSDTSASGS